MPSLHELQSACMRAILDGSAGDAAPLILARGITPAQRLNVYGGNARANFMASLQSSFPAIRRLVGEDYFRQSAREFQNSHPSRCGDLLHAGEHFAHYLAQLHGNDQFSYLGEVARFEWLCQEALLASDHPPLDLAKLKALTPAAYDALRFHLHPTLRLFSSKFPALRIWRANVLDDSQPEVIDLDGAADRLLILRRDLQLIFLPLDPGEEAFIRALQQGLCFAAAVETGSACRIEFDAGAALQRFVPARAIVDFSTDVA